MSHADQTLRSSQGPGEEPGNDRDEALPPGLWSLLRGWLRHLPLAAVALSLMLHVLGGLVAAWVVVGGGGGSAGSGEGAPIEMAYLSQGELDAAVGEALGVETPSVPEAELPRDRETAAVQDVGPGEGAGGPIEVTGVGSLAGGGDVGNGSGMGLGGSGGGGGASFFGAEARGNRFAYVIDVSSSMEGGRIAQLRRELSRSIDGLLESSEFLIVQYSTDARVVGEREGWTQASASAKKEFKTHIGLLFPDGATNPLPGFQIVAGVKPRPDAIYFMTDGEFADEVAEGILALHKQLRAPVHCICLESGEGEAKMRRIAQTTRGTFTFVRAR